MDLVTSIGQKHILREFLSMNQITPLYAAEQKILKLKLKKINRSNDYIRRFNYIGAPE
jgi:hypothetical protein